jgi:hypothetical protein
MTSSAASKWNDATFLVVQRTRVGCRRQPAAHLTAARRQVDRRPLTN